MKLIDGKQVATEIKLNIAAEAKEFYKKTDRMPHLAAILVGDDSASKMYVASKEKACRETGIFSSVYRFTSEVSEKELLATVDFLNNDDDVDAFIVQLPLPAKFDTNMIIGCIDPYKDADGIHPLNVGKMFNGVPSFLPATPAGIMTLLEKYQIETEGKHCVVVGRSNIVGRPVSILMSQNKKYANSTVTLCHSKTKDLKEVTLSADILIVAMGQPEFIKADMVKDGCVLIDVGSHYIPDESEEKGYRICGDVLFSEVSKKCEYITPVPGGVGPMTVVSLLQNVIHAAKKTYY